MRNIKRLRLINVILLLMMNKIQFWLKMNWKWLKIHIKYNIIQIEKESKISINNLYNNVKDWCQTQMIIHLKIRNKR